MIFCNVNTCGQGATQGGIFRHQSGKAVANPVYYFCTEHAPSLLVGAGETWRVEQ